MVLPEIMLLGMRCGSSTRRERSTCWAQSAVKDQKADLMLCSGPELRFRAIIARDLGIVLADVDDGSRVGSRSVVITRLFQSDAKIPQWTS